MIQGKKVLLIMTLGLFGVVVVAFVFYYRENIIAHSITKQPIQVAIPTPTSIEEQSITPESLPTGISTTAQTNPPVVYDATQTKKMESLFTTAQPLSASDKSAIQSIAQKRDMSTDVVYQGDDFRIDFLPSLQVFQVEIQSTDTITAKAHATVWLEAQGLSKNGICTMPVTFYLNGDIANQLRNKHLTFSPLADGC